MDLARLLKLPERASSPNLALGVLRFVFILVAAGVSVGLIYSDAFSRGAMVTWTIFCSVIGLALIVIGIDIAVRRKRLETVTAVYFGMLIGLFLTYVLLLALNPLLLNLTRDQVYAVQVVLAMVFCYGCISILLQTKDDFRFIIPYVEFAKDVKGLKPFVLDTSVIIDGRIADVIETRMLDNQLVMPRFVISELQAIADSSDRLRRSRGRRGLDILNRLRESGKVDLEIFDHDLPDFDGQAVDMKLVLLAKHLGGKVVTNDYNLNKVAQLHGVSVLNLNDLANALKPVFLPGEFLEVRIIKPGEAHGQGVGYLEDGTMIVVEGGREHVNRTVRVGVTSVLQTSAGRMVFGKYDPPVSKPAPVERAPSP